MERHNGQTRWRLRDDPEPREHESLRPGQPCNVPGCLKRGVGKPYCIDHLDRIPYIRRLNAEIADGVAAPRAKCAECKRRFVPSRDTQIVCQACAKVIHSRGVWRAQQ